MKLLEALFRKTNEKKKHWKESKTCKVSSIGRIFSKFYPASISIGPFSSTTSSGGDSFELCSMNNKTSSTNETNSNSSTSLPLYHCAASRFIAFAAFNDYDFSSTTVSPDVHCPSNIFNPQQLLQLLERMEERIASLKLPILVFSTERHGTSLRTFYALAEAQEESILLVETTDGVRFGAYCSDSWRNWKESRGTFFGRGTTFVFRCDCDDVKVYRWVGDSQNCETSLFLRGDMNSIGIGGGCINGGGYAIYLNDTFSSGSTNSSLTFDNPPLVPQSHFRVKRVELLGFESV